MTLTRETSEAKLTFDPLISAGQYTLILESLHASNVVSTETMTVSVVEYYRDPSEAVASQLEFLADSPPRLDVFNIKANPSAQDPSNVHLR